MSKTATSNTTSTPELLTFEEVATVTRAKPRTIARWVADGRLPVTRLGRRVLISRAALEAFIESGTSAATTGPLAGRQW